MYVALLPAAPVCNPMTIAIVLDTLFMEPDVVSKNIAIVTTTHLKARTTSIHAVSSPCWLQQSVSNSKVESQEN